METCNIVLREMLSWFNLSTLPFTKEIDTQKLFLLPTVEKALKQLQFLVSIRGTGVLTGKSGTGKSCILRLLVESLPKANYHVAYICHSSVSTAEFYSHLAAGFGLPPTGRRSMLYRKIKEQIAGLHASKRIYSVLVIDEAHLLASDILAELRLLSNFEMDSKNLLTIILCGQDDLLQKFGLASLEFLANSISTIAKLNGLEQDETYTYIEKNVSESGLSVPLFTKAAMNTIYLASGGAMRIINTLALTAMQKVFIVKQKQVEAEHVQAMLAR